MKKTIALLLCIVMSTMVFISSSMAEPFTMSNGIQFGDSPTTVKQKESLSYEKTEDGALVFSGTVLGYECEVKYYFENNGLVDVLYEFKSNREPSDASEQYNKVKDFVIQQYGEPMDNPDGTLYKIFGKAFEEAFNMIKAAQVFGDPSDKVTYNEWLYENGTSQTKIDTFEYYGSVSFQGSRIYYYTVLLSYHCITK